MLHASALLPLALLGGGVHEVRTGDAPKYSPPGLRVAAGDTVRWDASQRHPLAFEDGSGGPYDADHERTLTTPGKLAFYCLVHGAPGGAGMSGLVTVGDSNEAPSITLERETAEPRDGELVVFRALAGDPERLALRIAWDLDGDGRFDPHLGGVSAVARYGPGVHTVNARATDDLGLTADGRLTFTIPAPPAAPKPPSDASPPAAAPPAVTNADSAPAPTPQVHAARAIRLATVRRRGLRVTVTAAPPGRLSAELRDLRGRRLARVTATARSGTPVTMRLRAPRIRAGRARLVVRTADGRSISHPLIVRA
ncbi:hypothetical protein OJ997_27325 [Solirubrobacter phytolaccae]|uniref:Blue (type 1) copper domain-containing protein n=1 Tax=Solirubrobacter phytolaccae TaxID=1404360 RepID=A0A9X3NFJ1_9ACTN|nr:hypothetical protein [Solirubrobacter phytolaccae]MDA0184050.1 hypothetical protein [Solirubrobacter phytolaccae]